MQVVGTAEIFCLWLEINCFAGLVGIVSGMDLRSVGEKYLTKISEKHMAHVIKTYQPFLVDCTKTSYSHENRERRTTKTTVKSAAMTTGPPPNGTGTSSALTCVKLVFLPWNLLENISAANPAFLVKLDLELSKNKEQKMTLKGEEWIKPSCTSIWKFFTTLIDHMISQVHIVSGKWFCLHIFILIV